MGKLGANFNCLEINVSFWLLADDCKKRFKNMRDYFFTLRKKKQDKHWAFYNSLEFLAAAVESHK